MLNNLQNTNFKSKIIVSKNCFNSKPLLELKQQGKYVGFPWTMEQAKFFNEEGYTDNVGVCTAGILKQKGGDKFFLFHLIPSCDWEEVEKGLKGVCEAFKKTGKDIESFLIGGWIYKDMGMEEGINIVNLFQNLGVKTTALFGQKNFGGSALHYSLPKDEATIIFNDCNTVTDVNELKKPFSKIILGDCDSFEFEGKF